MLDLACVLFSPVSRSSILVFHYEAESSGSYIHGLLHMTIPQVAALGLRGGAKAGAASHNLLINNGEVTRVRATQLHFTRHTQSRSHSKGTVQLSMHYTKGINP